MKLVTQDHLRKMLRVAWESRGSQAAMAREIGVKPQNLSVMLNGSPINGKVLAWLGYEPVRGMFRRVTKQTKRGLIEKDRSEHV